MSVPCWYSDSKTLILKGANSEAIKLFGYSEEELSRIDFMRLFTKLDAQRVLAIRREEKWGIIGTFTFLRKDGSTFSAGLRWHQGEYRGTLCDCFIVTEVDLNENSPTEEECECNGPTS